MIEVYGTTLALVTEIKPAMLVRWLAGFHVVVDVQRVDDGAIRVWLDDGDTITLGPKRKCKRSKQRVNVNNARRLCVKPRTVRQFSFEWVRAARPRPLCRRLRPV